MMIMSYEASHFYSNRNNSDTRIHHTLKLASLFSGGKDSAYAAFLAKQQGHDIKCLITILPKSDESLLLHHPNATWTYIQAQSMQIPHMTASVKAGDVVDELDTLKDVVMRAKNEFDINGIVHGGISSIFQLNKFHDLCKKCHIEMVAPLWHTSAQKYMFGLNSDGFQYIITSVSAGGLDNTWLGKQIKEEDVIILADLAKKYGFNLNFEGGEAETFVTNCPLFSKPIKIQHGKSFWDGYRGRFEITDAIVENDA